MSTNLSKQKRKDLTGKIKAIHKYIASAKQDENTRNMLSWLSDIEKEINARKFGLVFEEHREAIDETLETHTPVLSENKKLFIDNGGQVNFLIEGDNLAALQLLLKTHKGKIDVIYIDPPYNTGDKDFIYDDDYVDKEDGYKHSKWISFMQKRLEIAKAILSANGVIFISINDIESAQLRMLCSEIFGELNFYGNITWQSRNKSTNSGKARRQIQQGIEYILAYGKKPLAVFEGFEMLYKDEEKSYPHNGIFGKCRFENLEATDLGRKQRDTMKFEILGVKPRGGRRWQIGEETAQRLEREQKIELVNGIPKLAVYPDDDQNPFIPFWSNLENVGSAETGKKELSAIIGDRHGFDTVKPTKLILALLKRMSKNAKIVDFFAGCGTSGHAVLKLNQDDGGKRMFILCTNNENNICRDITYERIKRVIKKEDYSASLKYYKIDYIPISDRLYYEYADELLEHIRELVELENGINFLGNDKIAIVLTDEELDDFVKNIKKHKNCRKLYRAHNVLVSAEQAAKLKIARIKVNVIPDYYYGELET